MIFVYFILYIVMSYIFNILLLKFSIRTRHMYIDEIKILLFFSPISVWLILISVLADFFSVFFNKLVSWIMK